MANKSQTMTPREVVSVAVYFLFGSIAISGGALYCCAIALPSVARPASFAELPCAVVGTIEISLSCIRFETAGESHGECLVATLTGLPAGVPVSIAAIDRELWRRQQGYGRGGRMKIETDKAHIVSGVRHSATIGSPIAILLENKDWKNWTEALPVEDMDGGEEKKKPVTRPRPGHADLAGCIKYDFHDARYIFWSAPAPVKPPLASQLEHWPKPILQNSASAC